MKPVYTPTRVALYARVSTFVGQNPEMQLRDLREYCQRRRFEISEEYVDHGVSGSRERRPSLDKLLGVQAKLAEYGWPKDVLSPN